MRNGSRSVIVGTGSHVPTRTVTNADFLDREFFGSDGRPMDRSNAEIVEKFEKITGITKRRWVTDDLVASDIAAMAARPVAATAAVRITPSG